MVSHPRPGARIRRRAGTAVAVLLTLCIVVALATAPAFAGSRQAADPPAEDDELATAVEDGIEFLLGRQEGDGGFGAASQATADAVSALAQQAQTGDEWSAREAIDAVSAVETEGGATPLDALDALAQDDPTPQLAARLISRAVVAMGLDPENFDPRGNGEPVDLVHIVAAARRDDGSYGTTLDTAEAVLALVQSAKPVNQATVELLQETQESNGGWLADETTGEGGFDVRTTGTVVQALVAAGAPVTGDVPAARAITFLARNQNDDGGWPLERDGDSQPEATAAAMGAIRAAGYDPVLECWRDAYGGDATTTYESPATAIADSQASDGSLQPALDPAQTTSVGIQGMLGRWLPTSRAETVTCGGGDDGGFPIPPSLIVIGVIAVVLVAGAVRIMRTSN